MSSWFIPNPYLLLNDLSLYCLTPTCSLMTHLCFSRAGTEYSVAVAGVFDNGVSLPLAGEEKTTLVDVTETPLPPAPSGKVPINHMAVPVNHLTVPINCL